MKSGFYFIYAFWLIQIFYKLFLLFVLILILVAMIQPTHKFTHVMKA